MIPPREKPSRLAAVPDPDKAIPLPGDLPPNPEEFLSITRDYFSLLREHLLSLRTTETSGRKTVGEYSRIVDVIVGILFQEAARQHGQSADRTDIAIIGMGGYGRAELAPYSDVDILIVCKRKTLSVKKIASAFVQLMWDMGFELGHAVESIVESESAISRSMDKMTALFESRWICGSRKIARQIEVMVSRMKRRDREAFIRRKIKDAVARHKKYGNSYQLIEPNVKLSPGGLRDYQTLVWIGMVNRGRTGLAALRRKGLLLAGEEKALREAYDFLLKVRVELHLATKSKQDQLVVRMQKFVADRFGYGGKEGHLGVEMFMKDYYNYTRTVFRITEDVLEDLESGKNIGVLLGRKRVAGERGKLSARVLRGRVGRDPLLVFFRQKETGLKLSRSLKRRLEAVVNAGLSEKTDSTAMRVRFPELVRDGRNVSLVLRSMHETGFLGAIIPEYTELTSLKRYDLYHHYTVDEHSFKVVRNLEFLGEERRGRDPLARIYSEISDKQVLFLAALLHDIGKIEGRGHAEKGAVLAKKILERMSFPPERIESVSYLIRIHLLMSHYSQRRDASDIGILQAFCSKVRTRANLKLLCLLTYADLKATSPVVWTEWKRSLVWELYLKAYLFLEKKEKQPEAVYKARKQTLLRAFAEGKEREAALRHLDKLPGRYLLTMHASQVRDHLRLISALRNELAAVGMRRRRGSTEITFCTPDKPFRLAQLCGVLTLNDCNILFANAFTRADGTVIDVFRVEDLSGTAKINEERIEHIRLDLVGVLKGKIDINTAFDKHIAKWKRKKDSAIPAPLRVEFENDVSKDVTIIDIFAMDEPGLLFRIARSLSNEGLVIHRARISTEANRAIDSFDVQDKRGRKITDVIRLRKIRESLERELS